MDESQKDLGKVWELAGQAMHALEAQYTSMMEEAAAQAGLTEPAWHAWLLAALAFEPDAISTARLRVRSPYVAPRWYEERLATAAAGSYLRCVDRDGYMLTPKGHGATLAVILAAYSGMAQWAPLEKTGMEKLAGLLQRLVEASLATPEPPGRWCLAYSRKSDPASVWVAVQIDQYLTDLRAYRDDCHLAAWAPLGIDGPALEALTFLWRAADPLSLDGLFDLLKRRGWDQSEYRERLGELIRLGWVDEMGDTFTATSQGRRIRQEVEEKTDFYFYKPWERLAPAELKELSDLLKAVVRIP